jgi:beta-alanine--pyruvate transaminase
MRAGANSVGEAFWMPYTDNRSFKASPRLLARAEGMHYWTPDGRQLLDGAAGIWCVNAGHGRRRIVEAIQAQAAELDFAPSFQIGHPLAFELAERVGALMPAGLDRIFFANSGSEAVETALKIALAVQRARGQGTRTRLIGRERGYHGSGFGGMSVGGIMPNRRAFGTGLPGVDHLPHTHDLARNAFSHGQPDHGAERAEALEALVALHGADTIAAVIVEPLAGSTGVLVPPKGYLERLREICTRHGILLIFDEVITGFGRLGAATASEAIGVVPDMICLAKGITNGAVPMGAVACGRELYDTLMGSSGDAPGIELFHGYTYSAHPLACAASLATLDVYAEEGLFARAAGLAAHWQAAVHRLADAPHVIDIRNMGLVAGIEMAPDPAAPGARGQALFRHLFDHGLLARATGDIIALSPPLIVSSDEIDEMVSRVADALAAMT